jgi:ribosomal protein S18 acetylase RimI-like enzyme
MGDDLAARVTALEGAVVALASVELGESEGHPFRGNQWTSGEGGGEDNAWTGMNPGGEVKGLPEGWKFSTGYGDAVPGGYNGTIYAYDAEGAVRGQISYQMEHGSNEGSIAMVEVEPEFRRQGIADALLDQLRREIPEVTKWDPGVLTDEGAKWWKGS